MKRLYAGSDYYNRAARRRGWGKFFGGGVERQGAIIEAWLAVFGWTFWLGWRTTP